MAVKEALQIITPRSMQFCRKMNEISKPLLKHQIDGFSYSVVQDIFKGQKLRTRLFYSDEKLLEFYINSIGDLNDSAFLEQKKLPFNSTMFYDSYHPDYTSNDDSIMRINIKYGIKNSIIFSIRDDHRLCTELFWFYTMNDNGNWFSEQLRKNLSLLKHFTLYLRDQGSCFINKNLITKSEINSIFSNICLLNTDNQLCVDENIENDIKINKYHLGYPFFKPLTTREVEVLKSYMLGMPSKDISEIHKKSPRTIEKTIENIRLKSHASCLRTLKKLLFESSSFYKLLIEK